MKGMLSLISLLMVVVHTMLGCVTIPLYDALVIDAMGHTVIGGIAGGFLIAHSLHSPLLFVGALVAVLCMHFLTFYLHTHRAVSYDSAMGISFSLFFALGIFIISFYARSVHLDLDMILLGNIEYALYDLVAAPQWLLSLFSLSPFFLPRMVWIGILLLVLLIVGGIFWYRTLVMILFDPVMGHMKGARVLLLQGIMIIINSYAIVSSLSALGTIALVGITITPFAFFWKRTGSYSEFIMKSMMMNGILTIVGIMISMWHDLPLGATITVTMTLSGLMVLMLRRR